MSSLIFLLIFFLVVLGSLYLIFRQKINIFLFPDYYKYIFMENDDDIKIWAEKIKDSNSFKYKDGTYYFNKPFKIREVKDEIQKFEDNKI